MSDDEEGVRTFSESERANLRLASQVKELMECPGWKHYAAILEQQIAWRRKILETPLDKLPTQDYQNLDHGTRVAALESIKGALIGLQLARDLPQHTIDAAKEIRNSAQEEQPDA